MKTFTLATGIALIFSGTTQLHAQEQKRMSMSWEALVQRADGNRDGKVAREEFKGPAPLFERWDLNKDGIVTKEEHAQATGTPPPANNTPAPSANSTRPAPTHANVSYGPHERNVFDLWLAKSDKPTPLAIFIHGGGFIGGGKEQLNARELSALLEAGISVASFNYRLLAQAPLPAAHQDVARAVQFLRSKAGEWNLDKTRFGGFGGSAGAQLVMYLAFHDDLADAKNSDTVARESSRLACVAPNAGQITMDMKWWDKHVPYYAEKAQRRRNNQELFGTDDEAAAMKINADIAAISLISRDDPPVFMSYGMAPDSALPTDNTQSNWLIHHVIHGIELKKLCDQLGVEAHLKYPGAQVRYASSVDFFKAKLLASADQTNRKPTDGAAPSKRLPRDPSGGIFFYAKEGYDSNTAPIANPDVLGNWVQFYWSEIEKEKGHYDWSLIDSRMKPWVAAGRKVAFRVYWIGSGYWRNPAARVATPQSVWADGAKFVKHADSGTEIPLIWDPIYQKRAMAFLTALAARYDGNTNVLFFDVTPGAETNPYRFVAFNQRTPEFKDQYAATPASDGRNYSDELWLATVRQWIDSTDKIFKQLPLVVTLNVGTLNLGDARKDHSVEIGQYAVDRGFYVGQNGLHGASYIEDSGRKTAFLKWSKQTRIVFETLGDAGTSTQYGKKALGTLREIVDAANRVNAHYLLPYPVDVLKGTQGQPNYDPEFASALAHGARTLGKGGVASAQVAPTTPAPAPPQRTAQAAAQKKGPPAGARPRDTKPSWLMPRIEGANLHYKTFDSKAAGEKVSYLIYLPPGYEESGTKRYPVMYWLHGIGGSQQGVPGITARLTAAIEAGKCPPFIGVFANGMINSFYCDVLKDNRPVETVIIKELVPHVDATYRTIAKREGRLMEGFSMGGYGAGHLGFKYPELFGSVSIIDGALVDLNTMRQRHAQLFEQIFSGSEELFTAAHPRTLVEKNAALIKGRTVIRQTVGALAAPNAAMHEHLTKLGIEHDYDAYPDAGHNVGLLYERLGDKNWDFYKRAFAQVVTARNEAVKTGAASAATETTPAPPQRTAQAAAQKKGSAAGERPRDTEPSWLMPPVEGANLHYKTFDSQLAAQKVSYLLYLPPGYESSGGKRYPVVYWLHGIGGSQQGVPGMTARMTEAINAAKMPPLIMVFVNGMIRSSWVDSFDGKTPVESVAIKELIPHVDATYRTIATRAGRMIEGFSMGGGGAAKWGFKHPDLFGSISIVDGALHKPGDPTAGRLASSFQSIYGGNRDYFEASNPWNLAEKNADKVKDRTPVRIITRTTGLGGLNKEFSEVLTRLGVTNEFHAVPDAPHSPGPLYEGIGDKNWAFYQRVFGTVASAGGADAAPAKSATTPAPAPSAPAEARAPQGFHLSGERWTYRDGEFAMNGILLKPEGKGPFPAVLISHGLGGSAESFGLNKAREMVKWGFVCIAPDYTHSAKFMAGQRPGGGKGAPKGGAGKGATKTDAGGPRANPNYGTYGASEENIRRARTCIEIVSKMPDVDAKCIAGYGHSMGGFVTIGLAASSPELLKVAAISGSGVAPQDGFPAPSAVKAETVRTPFLILHGSVDPVVRPQQSADFKAILDRHQVPNQRTVYEGEGHPVDQTKREEVFTAIRDWFAKHGVLAP